MQKQNISHIATWHSLAFSASICSRNLPLGGKGQPFLSFSQNNLLFERNISEVRTTHHETRGITQVVLDYASLRSNNNSKEDYMKVKPLAGYILIEPVEAETKTASGIILPDTATQDKPSLGKVVEVGPAKKHPQHTEEPPAKKGDSVIYRKWGGEDLKLDNKELKLVKFEDVMAIVL